MAQDPGDELRAQQAHAVLVRRKVAEAFAAIIEVGASVGFHMEQLEERTMMSGWNGGRVTFQVYDPDTLAVVATALKAEAAARLLNKAGAAHE